MNSIYNIYFATSRLAITPEPIDGINKTISIEDIDSPEELCRILGVHENIEIITPSPKDTFEKVASLFKWVVAAGGVVRDEQGLSLMIYRNGRWDLPKGHWESGETIEECAIREIEEETGVGGVKIERAICNTTHIYNMKGRWEIKRTHWFLLSTSHTATLTPQLEEGIERVEWCTQEQIERYYAGCFPTIQEVLSRA